MLDYGKRFEAANLHRLTLHGRQKVASEKNENKTKSIGNIQNRCAYYSKCRSNANTHWSKQFFWSIRESKKNMGIVYALNWFVLVVLSTRITSKSVSTKHKDWNDNISANRLCMPIHCSLTDGHWLILSQTLGSERTVWVPVCHHLIDLDSSFSL